MGPDFDTWNKEILGKRHFKLLLYVLINRKMSQECDKNTHKKLCLKIAFNANNQDKYLTFISFFSTTFNLEIENTPNKTLFLNIFQKHCAPMTRNFYIKLQKILI